MSAAERLEEHLTRRDLRDAIDQAACRHPGHDHQDVELASIEHKLDKILAALGVLDRRYSLDLGLG